jgi:hypothetical protein
MRCIGVVTAFTLFSLWATPYAGNVGLRLFLRPRQAELEAFVRDIDGYGRIHAMSDGLRLYKALNGQPVTFEPGPVDSALAWAQTVPVAWVLARDGIANSRYQDFRQRLIKLGLLDFEATTTCVRFGRDGFITHRYGYVYVRKQWMPMSSGSGFLPIEAARGSLEHVSGNWYYYSS